MTYPTFNNGDVLPASDLNAIGLWKISTTNVGTGVSSVNISNQFSADYYRYKIVYQGGFFSASGANLYLQYFGNGTNYFSAVIYQTATAYTILNTGLAGAAIAMVGITGNTSNSQYNIELTSPLASTWKVGESSFTAGDNANSYCGSTRFWNTNSTTSTGFSLYPSSGTMTGGTITVYGYKN
jgi:hypothetical protein